MEEKPKEGSGLRLDRRNLLANPERRDLVLTASSAVILAVLSIACLRLASVELSPDEMSMYVLGRRAIAFLAPIAMLGFGVGLPRFVAAATAGNSTAKGLGGLLIIAGVGIAAALCGVWLAATAWRPEASTLVFGGSGSGAAIVGTWLMLAGTCACALVYGYLRGRFRYAWSNIFNVLNSGVTPLVGVIAANGRADVALTVAGFGQFVLAAVGGAVAVVQDVRSGALSFSMRRVDAVSFVRYSLPRTPGDLAVAALMAAPTFTLLHVASKAAAAVAGIAMSVLGLVTSALGPVSTVLLTAVTRRIAEARQSALHSRAVLLIKITVASGGATAIVASLGSSVIVSYVLGVHFIPQAWVLGVLALGIPGWALVVAMRSFVDALHMSARNARNAIIAVAMFVLLGGAFGGASSSSAWECIAFVVAMSVLGIQTARDALRLTAAVKGA